MTGSVTGSVVQAGTVYSGVHLNLPRAPVVPRQLPATSSLFAGREAELTDIDEMLGITTPGTGRMIAVIGGAGGIGKTWLAVAWANRRADRFPDGQLFADLRGFSPEGEPTPPGTVVRRFLDALDVDPARVPDDIEAQVALYRSVVAGRRMLIVLDNAVDVGQVEPLLPGGTSCRVVITSRNRPTGLIVRHDARFFRLDALDVSQARDLLAGRIGAERIAAEVAAVAELIELCGGFPLALGIVAARAQNNPRLPLAEFVTELRLSVVDSLDDSDPAASLPTVLSVSYRELSAGQRRVLTLLAAAPGADIALPAAAALVGLSAKVTHATLGALEDASLLDRRPGNRYVMHDLIRTHARERQVGCLDSDDLDRAREGLTNFYRRAAFTADKLLLFEDGVTPFDAPFPADRAAALGWLRAEQDNLVACLDDLAARNRTVGIVGLTASLAAFWRQENPGTPAVDRHQRAVRFCRDHGNPAGEAKALLDLGRMHAMLGGYVAATEAYERAEELFTALGDHVGLATTVNCLGNLRQRTDDHWGSVALYERALELFRMAGYRPGEARALANLGHVRQMFAEYSHAIEYLERSAALYRELGDDTGQADVLLVRGRVEEWSENHEAAAGFYREALRLNEKLESRAGQAQANLLLGGVDERSTERYERALELYRELGNRHGEGNTLCQLAGEKSEAGHYEEAERLLNEAMSVWEELGHQQGKGNVLATLGELRLRTHDLDDADRLLREALELFDRLQDRMGMANVHHLRGMVRDESGNWSEAERFFRSSYDQWHELGHRRGQTEALNRIGTLRLNRHGPKPALEAHRQALELAPPQSLLAANSLEAIAECERRLGNRPAALAALRESLITHRRLGTPGATSVAKKLNELEDEPREGTHGEGPDVRDLAADRERSGERPGLSN